MSKSDKTIDQLAREMAELREREGGWSMLVANSRQGKTRNRKCAIHACTPVNWTS